VRPQHPDLEVSGVGRVTRQALEDHAAERVDVGPPVHGIALDVLGRHVVDRADQLTGCRESAHRERPFCQTEVGDVHVVLGRQEHVAGLNIPVDEPERVGGIERTRDLTDDRGGAIGV
jgi:hypothetical protein